MQWLTAVLKDKLKNRELDASIKSDMETLLSVLQDPVFGKIVTIEVSPLILIKAMPMNGLHFDGNVLHERANRAAIQRKCEKEPQSQSDPSLCLVLFLSSASAPSFT